MNPDFITVEPGHLFTVAYPVIELCDNQIQLPGVGGPLVDGENHAICYRRGDKKHSFRQCTHGFTSHFGMTRKPPTNHESIAVIESYGETTIADDSNVVRSQKMRLKAIVLRDVDEILQEQETFERSRLERMTRTYKVAKFEILDNSVAFSMLVGFAIVMIWLGITSPISLFSVGCYSIAAYLGFKSVKHARTIWKKAALALKSRPNGKHYKKQTRIIEERIARHRARILNGLSPEEYGKAARAMVENHYPGTKIYPDFKSLLFAYQDKITLHGSIIRKYAREGWPKIDNDTNVR